MTWLARLQQGGKAPQVDLEVVTNLSNVRPEIYDLFSAFKSLRITLSIDGHGAGYEYVRFPGKWDVLTRNVARLKERCPTAVIVINCVLQALNAHNLVDLFDWADTNDIPIHLSIGRGLEGYNDYRILPATVRQDVRVRFERYFERKANRGLGYQAATVWSALDEIEASAFDEATRRERLGGLLEFISDMDRSRRLSFRADAPDLYAALMRDHTSP